MPEWADPTDPRRAITLQHLLEMRDGLDFVEDYVDARVSDVIEMLFGAGKDDVAGFAADRPPVAAPGQPVQLLERHQQHRVGHRRPRGRAG